MAFVSSMLHTQVYGMFGLFDTYWIPSLIQYICEFIQKKHIWVMQKICISLDNAVKKTNSYIYILLRMMRFWNKYIQVRPSLKDKEIGKPSNFKIFRSKLMMIFPSNYSSYVRRHSLYILIRNTMMVYFDCKIHYV